MSASILIIDDFASVRLYHQSFLSHQGYRCVAVSTCEEAQSALTTGTFDLILLDLMMPGLGGAGFLAWLDQHPGGDRLPVLVISSEPTGSEKRHVSAKRVIGHLAKPVGPQALLREVHRLLARAPAVHP